MRKHRVTLEPGNFSDEFEKSERERAFEALKACDSFVLITKQGGGNSCVSVIAAEHTKIMAFNCHLAEQEIIKTIEDIEGLGE